MTARMRHLSIAATLAVCALCLLAPAAGAAWEEVGEPISGLGSYADVDFENLGGRPYVAYATTDHVIVVRRLSDDGESWEQVGPPVNHSLAGQAGNPSLAVSPDGVPWIAWAEWSDGVQQIRAAHLSDDGTEWVEPDDRYFSINVTLSVEAVGEGNNRWWSATAPHIVFFAGRPYIAYLQDNPSEYTIAVVRLAADGRSWEGISTRNLPHIPRNGGPDLAVIDGRLYMGVGRGFDGVTAHRLSSDGTWQQLGGGDVNISVPDGHGYGRYGGYVGIAGFGGDPHVLWTVRDEFREAVVSRPAGDTWELAGGVLGPGGTASAIRQIGGRLWATWGDDDGAHLSRLSDDGSAWIEIGDPTAGRAWWLAGIDGVPHVALASLDPGVTSIQILRLTDAPAPVGSDEDGSGPGDDSGVAGHPRLPPREEEPPEEPPVDPPPGDPPPAMGPCGPEILGTAAPERLVGTARGDTIRGLEGDDLLLGLARSDCLFGGDGDDVLRGAAGSDRLRGGADNDELNGGADEDRLYGDSGNDLLYGHADEDRLVGGTGADVLAGGAGWDEFRAGPGDDTIDAADGRGETVRCGAGADRVRADRYDRLAGCESVRVVR